MTRRQTFAHALLWATAIVASASLQAPSFLSLIVLPALGAMALLAQSAPAQRAACKEDLTAGRPSSYRPVKQR